MTGTRVAVVVSGLFVAGVVGAQDSLPQAPRAADEHAFLRQFVGRWECDGEAFMEPGKPSLKIKSTMSGHMIGDFWATLVVKADSSDVLEQPYHGQGTYGYDTKNEKYVGTWTDSMSDFLWRYEGKVEGNSLILHFKGPHPSDPAKTMTGRDTWEFKSKDLLILTGEYEGPDGKWLTMVKTVCRRAK